MSCKLSSVYTKMCAIVLHGGRRQCEKRSIVGPSLGTFAKPFNSLILACPYMPKVPPFPCLSSLKIYTPSLIPLNMWHFEEYDILVDLGFQVTT